MKTSSQRPVCVIPWAPAILFAVTAIGTIFSVDGSGAGKCVMRGTCDADGTRAPCVYDGEPKAIESAAAREVLESVCGDVLGNGSQPVCCDANQAEDFAENLQSAKAIGLDNCAACSRNFRTLMCHMVCSPRQADFLQLLASEVSEDKEKYVASLNYYVTPTFVRGMFDSCKDSRSKIPSIKLFNFMCGRWGANCTAERWLAFLGASPSDGGLSPITIKHVQTDKEHKTPEGAVFKPLSVEAYACNQDRGTVKACSCENCKAACA
ncbi:NPC intracellular cholesterol transporter 1-like [Dermacentor variabilis]|uniref:NPC intracellular cholesterol transporter 1-like n=1 Tax=Dermacentor variabilis TaxID=34621 RepID=UPI003F5B0E79